MLIGVHTHPSFLAYKCAHALNTNAYIGTVAIHTLFIVGHVRISDHQVTRGKLSKSYHTVMRSVELQRSDHKFSSLTFIRARALCSVVLHFIWLIYAGLKHCLGFSDYHITPAYTRRIVGIPAGLKCRNIL